METPPSQVSTTRLGDPGRGPSIVVLLAVAFVGVAVVSAGVAGSSALAPRPVASAAAVDPPPSPSAMPSLRPGEMACMPAGWRLAYTGSMASRSVETWLVITPGPASGPLDEGIPVSHLGHDVVAGLGACAPPVGPDGGGRPAVIERAWRLGRAGGSVVETPIEMLALDPAPARVVRPDALELVRPADGTRRGWSAGDYVLELDAPASAGEPTSASSAAWIRIELDSPTP